LVKTGCDVDVEGVADKAAEVGEEAWTVLMRRCGGGGEVFVLNKRMWRRCEKE